MKKGTLYDIKSAKLGKKRGKLKILKILKRSISERWREYIAATEGTDSQILIDSNFVRLYKIHGKKRNTQLL